MARLELATEDDRHIVVTRLVAAPPEVVYRAHVEADTIRRWMLGPEGWDMPVCVSDPRPGGGIRFEWSDGESGSFHLTGEYVALEPFSRIVHVERMTRRPTTMSRPASRPRARGRGSPCA